MGYRDLRGFLAALQSTGELQTVEAEVDAELEIAAITDRQSKLAGGGSPLLFRRVRGTPHPVATNLFGSPSRMAAALGVKSLAELTPRMERLLADPAAAPAPRTVADPVCQEMVEEFPDLESYPFLKSWPG